MISFDTSTSMIMASPASPISPPSTATNPVGTDIFTFPSNSNIKQEDWSEVCNMQETPTASFPPGPIISQGSPMNISPTMSTLNTPRGSITSMRSQQSPMDNNQTPLADPMMSTYEAFDQAASSTAFVAYTTVSAIKNVYSVALTLSIKNVYSVILTLSIKTYTLLL